MKALGLRVLSAATIAVMTCGQAVASFAQEAEGIETTDTVGVAVVEKAVESDGGVPTVLIVGMALFVGAAVAFLKHQRR